MLKILSQWGLSNGSSKDKNCKIIDIKNDKKIHMESESITGEKSLG